MRNEITTADWVPESAVAALWLGCGLAALAVLVYLVDVPAWRGLSCVGALSLVALWWKWRRQERTLRQMRQMLGCLREETMMRRSTMRFIFDELLEGPVPVDAQTFQSRRQLQDFLTTASGFLELLAQDFWTQERTAARGYLKEARRALTQAVELVAKLSVGANGPMIRQSGLEPARSPNRSTVSVRKRW